VWYYPIHRQLAGLGYLAYFHCLLTYSSYFTLISCRASLILSQQPIQSVLTFTQISLPPDRRPVPYFPKIIITPIKLKIFISTRPHFTPPSKHFISMLSSQSYLSGTSRPSLFRSDSYTTLRQSGRITPILRPASTGNHVPRRREVDGLPPSVHIATNVLVSCPTASGLWKSWN
jgi:hypothetical protein